MSQILIDKVNITSVKSDAPNIKPGYTVRVHQKIKEGERERIQIFEGLVIKVNSGYGTNKTFTVRRIVSGIGVEKIFPIHSPNIAKIEVVKIAKIRRSKLYYMRNLTGKSARLKETYLNADDKTALDKASIIKAKEVEALKKEEAKQAMIDEKKAKEEAKKLEKEKSEKEIENNKSENNKSEIVEDAKEEKTTTNDIKVEESSDAKEE